MAEAQLLFEMATWGNSAFDAVDAALESFLEDHPELFFELAWQAAFSDEAKYQYVASLFSQDFLAWDEQAGFQFCLHLLESEDSSASGFAREHLQEHIRQKSEAKLSVGLASAEGETDRSQGQRA